MLLFSYSLYFALDRSAYPYASPHSHIPFQFPSNSSNKSLPMCICCIIFNHSLHSIFFFLLSSPLFPSSSSYDSFCAAASIQLCVVCVCGLEFRNDTNHKGLNFQRNCNAIWMGEWGSDWLWIAFWLKKWSDVRPIVWWVCVSRKSWHAQETNMRCWIQMLA